MPDECITARKSSNGCERRKCHSFPQIQAKLPFLFLSWSFVNLITYYSLLLRSSILISYSQVTHLHVSVGLETYQIRIRVEKGNLYETSSATIPMYCLRYEIRALDRDINFFAELQHQKYRKWWLCLPWSPRCRLRPCLGQTVGGAVKLRILIYKNII